MVFLTCHRETSHAVLFKVLGSTLAAQKELHHPPWTHDLPHLEWWCSNGKWQTKIQNIRNEQTNEIPTNTNKLFQPKVYPRKTSPHTKTLLDPLIAAPTTGLPTSVHRIPTSCAFWWWPLGVPRAAGSLLDDPHGARNEPGTSNLLHFCLSSSKMCLPTKKRNFANKFLRSNNGWVVNLPTATLQILLDHLTHKIPVTWDRGSAKPEKHSPWYLQRPKLHCFTTLSRCTSSTRGHHGVQSRPSPTLDGYGLHATKCFPTKKLSRTWQDRKTPKSKWRKGPTCPKMYILCW